MDSNDQSSLQVKFKDWVLEMSAPGLLFLMACCIIGVVIIEVTRGYSFTILVLIGALLFLSITFFALQLLKRISDENQKISESLKEIRESYLRVNESFQSTLVAIHQANSLIVSQLPPEAKIVAQAEQCKNRDPS